jgi:hypothetical protein
MRSIKKKKKGWPEYKSEELKGLWDILLKNEEIQERMKSHPEEKPAILQWISYGIYRYSEEDIGLGTKTAYYDQAIEPDTKPNYDMIRDLQNYLAEHGHDAELQYQLDLLLKQEQQFNEQRKIVRKSYEVPSLRAYIIGLIDDYLKGRKSQKYITRKRFGELENKGERQVRRIFKDRFDNKPACTKEEYRTYKQRIQDGDIISRPRKKAHQ